MRLRHPREWRSAYAAWSAKARMPTRMEARWYYAASAGIYIGLGGGAWWEPIGSICVVAAFVYTYVLWRMHTLWQPFLDLRWERDVAERTGWPPTLLLRGRNVLFVIAFASVVVSWLT